ncbi:T9SS type A sorting domain-containing protein [bacterium]|nr:T9SS type A sorting domain-containing protein [bacterium]
MIRTAIICTCLAVLFCLLSSAKASTDIAIDALHGLPELQDYGVDLETLYPEFDFVLFDKERIPLTDPIRYGLTRGNWDPTNIQVELTETVEALYVILDITYQPGSIDQLPFISVVAPDQAHYTGNYGKWHLDNPPLGSYDITISWGEDQIRFRVGTGPSYWDAYPPEDYGAMLYLNGFTWQFFRGLPTLHSAADLTRIQEYLDNGGGYGLIYDAEEPVALKPIIQVRNFDSPVDLSLDVPGHLTYRKPQVKSDRPVQWSLNSASEAQEILYEAAFRQPLNFISYDANTNSVTNHSWATTRDVKLLEFIPFEGYRISDFGTIQQKAMRTAKTSAVLSGREAEDYLVRILREEALRSGMTEPENDSFFGHKYDWTPRLLAEVAANPGPVCLYRIEGSDYDGLIPLQVNPSPQEQVRILWVYSMLPENPAAIAPVHPKAVSRARTIDARSNGVVHEYGFFREHYGGDALDELEEWDWHCYDGSLYDPTNFDEWEERIQFHTTGSSPLVSTFMDQVQIVQGEFSTAIEPLAGDAEVVLKGDDDTQSWDTSMPFPAGSYPPVVVAREETAGGRLTAYSDLHFFQDYADNLQFSRNVLNWLKGEDQDPVPDIDIADAVIETTLVDDQQVTTTFTVLNRGDAALTFTAGFPDIDWLLAEGPTDTTLQAGASCSYQLTWIHAGLPEGFHTSTCHFSTNDPNESELDWPITLQMVRTSDVSPVAAKPSNFTLLNAYPNPFNSQISISFIVEKAATIDFMLVNILGQEMETLARRNWSNGVHSLNLDFSDKPSGLYFLKATAGNSHQLVKLMHLK